MDLSDYQEALSDDDERFDWLEKNTTLHKRVEIIFVADGYEVQVLHEDGVTELSPRFHGDTIREAIDKASKQ